MERTFHNLIFGAISAFMGYFAFCASIESKPFPFFVLCLGISVWNWSESETYLLLKEASMEKINTPKDAISLGYKFFDFIMYAGIHSEIPENIKETHQLRELPFDDNGNDAEKGAYALWIRPNA